MVERTDHRLRCPGQGLCLRRWCGSTQIEQIQSHFRTLSRTRIVLAVRTNRQSQAKIQARECVIAIALLFACCVSISAAVAESTIVSIDGPRFTLNDKPTFLLGISYYGGLGAPKEFVRRDLDDQSGFSERD